MTMAAASFDEPVSFGHLPVMVQKLIELVAPEPGALYIDVTVGGAGHSSALLEAAPDTRVLALDRDPAAVQAARARLAPYGGRAEVVHASFDEIGTALAERGISHVRGLVADLGVSSQQLDDPRRGMSFRFEGPLDMRMDPTRGQTAKDLIEDLSQEELANLIYELGEERRSRRVARCVKQALDRGELETTHDLRRAVVRAVGPRRTGGIDPATRTFQALRLAVNGELDQLATLLATAAAIVEPGGVAAFISFHSLEDRMVKRALLERSVWERLTPKPLIASSEEQAQNPRSRSAKLRVARRVSPEETQ